MKIVLFYHSLVSDWNHGNAHFLRGVARELMSRGHRVEIYEPENGWSAANLRRDHGEAPLREFRRAFPELESVRYDEGFVSRGGVEAAVDGADLVIVHEWSSPGLVAKVGECCARADTRLFFHDTHHRSATEPEAMGAFDLSNYDGVLAFGEVVRERYLAEGWAERAWTWHEAADTRLFRPAVADGGGRADTPARRNGAGFPEIPHGDLVWIGNWGDEERTEELERFLLAPVRALRRETRRITANAYGVRYPARGRSAFEDAGFRYRGWLPNSRVPEAFARHGVTVHVPRAPYVRALPGVPTIRVFEALACGIPLVCSPWDDVEGLFTEGSDYLVARTGSAMREHLRAVLHDRDLAASLAEHGRRTILERHTCRHRVDQLLRIYDESACAGAADSRLATGTRR